MNLNQVAAMKAKVLEELQRVDRLKQSMEQTLAGLLQWEKYLQGTATSGGKAIAKKPHPGTGGRDHRPAREKTPSERINRALQKMHGEFSRAELLAEAEYDGKAIPPGTYGNIFLKLISTKQIRLVRGEVGRKNSRYMKSKEATLAQHGGLPENQGNGIDEGKGG